LWVFQFTTTQDRGGVEATHPPPNPGGLYIVKKQKLENPRLGGEKFGKMNEKKDTQKTKKRGAQPPPVPNPMGVIGFPLTRGEKLEKLGVGKGGA